MKRINTILLIMTALLLCLCAVSCTNDALPMQPSIRHDTIVRRPVKDMPERTLEWDAYEDDLQGCWSYRDGEFESILKFDNGRLTVFNGRYGGNGEYTSDGWTGSAEYYLTDGGISITDGDGNDSLAGYYSAVMADGRLEMTLIDGDEVTGSAHDTTVSYTRADEVPYVVIGFDRIDESGRSRLSFPTVLNPEHESSADFERLHAALVNEAVTQYESLTEGSGMIWLTRLYRDDRYIQVLTWKFNTSASDTGIGMNGTTVGIDSVVYDTGTRRTLTVDDMVRLAGITTVDAANVSAAVIRGDTVELYVIEDGAAYFHRCKGGEIVGRGEMYETFDGSSDEV